ncbi:MAG: hypothetical protein PSV13_12710 [Lacunisphaera sp.]|nr:hypothetical protein [Lacunisphaera sp.]
MLKPHQPVAGVFGAPPPLLAGRIWDHLIPGLALVCVLLSVAVFVRRGQAAIQAGTTAPGVAVTSGYEEESLFALWKAVHHQPVYTDATRLPFAASYFNWLFYHAYAFPVRAAVQVTGDSGLPVAGRLLTAIGALAGATILFMMSHRVLAGQPLVAAALSAFVFFGPLVGWWAHTVRPDLWALVLETGALAVLLAGYRRHPLGTAALVALLCYGAWSFKQTYVLGLGAALLFLLFRRQWRPAGLLAVVSIGLWLATFLLLGPDYRAAFLHTATTNLYSPAMGLRNLGDMLVKSSPLWLLAAAGLSRSGRPAGRAATPLADDTRLLGLLGLLVALPLSFAASCKLGAASNYHFTTMVMVSLLAASLLATAGSRRLLVPGLLAAAALQLLALLGHAGRTNLSGQTASLSAIWQVWQAQPEPRFSVLTNLNLPWVNAGSPPLVVAFNYYLERADGRSFERGGLGGLINAGSFQTLLLPADTQQKYDGGSLRHYRRGPTVGDLTVFHRDSTTTR